MLTKNTKWSRQEKELVVKLKTKYPGLTFKEIAFELKANGYTADRTDKAVQGIWRRYLEAMSDDNPEDKVVALEGYGSIAMKALSDIMQGYDPDEVSYSKALREMAKLRDNAVKEHNKNKMRIGNPVNPDIKIVCISDLHIPFYNENVIKKVIKEAPDTDVLVINGDFLEAYSVSSWPKNKAIMLRHEYEMGMKLLREFSRLFPKVILVRGNHEDRLRRYFSSNIDNNVSFLVSTDLLDRMAKGYDFNEDGELEIMHDMSNVFYNKGPLSWQVQIGKCIFAHPSNYSKISMRTATNVAQTLAGRGMDFEAIVIAHTHKQGSVVWQNKLVIEQGCACIPLDYEADPKSMYTGASYGYAVVYMDKEGHVDFDKSKTVYCGTGVIAEPKNNYSLED